MINLADIFADQLDAIICEGVAAVLAWPANDVLTREDEAIVALAKALAARCGGATGPTRREDIGIKAWCGNCGSEIDRGGEHICMLASWYPAAGDA